MSPIVLGFVLGPMLEENFRRAMLLSRGELSVFIERPIAAWFLAACLLLIAAQVFAYVRKRKEVQSFDPQDPHGPELIAE